MARLDSTDPLEAALAAAPPPVREPAIRPIDFSPVTGQGPRRWHPHHFIYAQVMRRFVGPAQRLLQIRCGVGVHAVRFAHLGYQTFGLDDREDRLLTARRYARKYGLASRCTFECAPPHAMPFPDNHFDVVIGFGALAWGRDAAAGEIARVLRPGAAALLVERVHDPAHPSPPPPLPPVPRAKDHLADLDDDADTPIIEHAVIENLGAAFRRVDCERFSLDQRMARLRVKLPGQVIERLTRLDTRLRQACPPLADLAQTVALVCEK